MADIPENIIGHWCDIEQYRMLKRCSDAEDMTGWSAWRKANPEDEVRLQGADLRRFYLKGANFEGAYCNGASFSLANCEGANFFRAHCEGVNFEVAQCKSTSFYGANCKGAYFWSACCEEADFSEARCSGAEFVRTHCDGADFWEAHCDGADFGFARCEGVDFAGARCEGANFRSAYCKDADFSNTFCNGANFSRACCDGASFREAHCEGSSFMLACLSGANFLNVTLSHRTRLVGSVVDDRTDFSNASLASVIIEPGTRALLERNIRRVSWTRWYGPSLWRKMLTLPMRLFWWLSDYGHSSKRIVVVFLGLIFLFAGLYTLFPHWLMIGNVPLRAKETYWAFGDTGFSWSMANFGQMLSFATSTMVTLGFSNINVAVNDGHPNGWGMIVVSLNLMTGYFMLAIIVTRLAILFQTLGPGTTPPARKDDKKSLDDGAETPEVPPDSPGSHPPGS